MSRLYTHLSLGERKEIENGLNQSLSIRSIADDLGRTPSTIAREIKKNSISLNEARKPAECPKKRWCRKAGICGDCVLPGALCADCMRRDCQGHCPDYSSSRSKCENLNSSPYVCNGCRRVRNGCGIQNRRLYKAVQANKSASARCSESREGVDMDSEHAERVLNIIKDGIKRGLSPYEIKELYGDTVTVSTGTIYNWVDKGYGGMSNLELERKVKFPVSRPRKKSAGKQVRHSRKRLHSSFEKLPQQLRDARTEMDCVVGRAHDRQAILTLYNLPTHFQLMLLLDAHDAAGVSKALKTLSSIMPEDVFESWFRVVLTDNGPEFSNEHELGAIFGESAVGGKLEPRLFYCDPRQSQQKGGCEKNHTELRQILRKGMFSFDDLVGADLAVVMSHVNSNPRASLGGKSPIEMAKFVYGEGFDAVLDAYGVSYVPRDELTLKPDVLDGERSYRGEEPLERLK